MKMLFGCHVAQFFPARTHSTHWTLASQMLAISVVFDQEAEPDGGAHNGLTAVSGGRSQWSTTSGFWIDWAVLAPVPG